MSKNIRVIFVLLSMVFIAFFYNIVKFYYDVDTVIKTDEPETNTVNVLRADLYSFGENGFYGVKDSSGRIIIEARWNSVEQIDSEKLIVSKYTSKGARYGVIDLSENIVIPFIYTSFVNYNDEFLAATTENKKTVLFDMKTNVLIDEEWDVFFKNYESLPLTAMGNYIQIEKKRNVFRIKSDTDGNLKMTSLRLKKDIFGNSCYIDISNSSSVLRLYDTYRIYNEIADNTLSYIDALFSNDTSVIKDLSWSDDFRSIQLENMNFRGSDIIYAPAPEISVTDDSAGRLVYMASVSVLYSSPDNINWDGTYTNSDNLVYFEITMRKKQNGSLGIVRVYTRKGEPDEINIPEEYKIRESDGSADSF